MKKMDKKTLLIVLITGLIIIILGVIFIKVLTEKLADLVLPDTMKKNYTNYILESDGVSIPIRIEYLTNNGKLFTFCQSFSSIIVAIISYIIVNKFGMRFYEKCDKNTVKNITKILGIIVLFLGVFTFTSKVNPNNNIEKYIIKFNHPGYSQKSDSTYGNKTNIIGYVNTLDFNSKDNLIAVYESPQFEPVPVSKNDYIGCFFTNFITKIAISICTLFVLPAILGIYIFVLNNFQKEI